MRPRTSPRSVAGAALLAATVAVVVAAPADAGGAGRPATVTRGLRDVRTPAPAGAPAAPATPQGTGAPRGDLPGWRQVLVDDFTTYVPLGGFPGPAYAGRWTGYDGAHDTSGAGTYRPARVVSVDDGVLDLHVRTEGGTPLVAAPVPLRDGQWGGWTYGRYSVRYRADAVPGYKTAWLLWPDSDDWSDGEVDFPEGDLDGTVHGFVHRPGAPEQNALAVDTGVRATDWHVATVEWRPEGVRFLLDGVLVGSTPVSPDRPMHLVLQTETSGGTPPAGAAGHVQVDWVALYRLV
ncbi:glycoside hydrolase family 16 protein [Kineococcus sp. NPDC059986]|uniref:glycoside hydrolase family 16 protein n=1 Tax=Kineococcus sp. NPDC059986 TaxID=3155538 RepID=UPI00344B499C